MENKNDNHAGPVQTCIRKLRHKRKIVKLQCCYFSFSPLLLLYIKNLGMNSCIKLTGIYDYGDSQ